MNQAHFAHRYTGARVFPFAPPAPFSFYPQSTPGYCRSCGYPSAQCRCGCRECRKEAKELLVEAKSDQTGTNTLGTASGLSNLGAIGVSVDPSVYRTGIFGTAFIGGGCCVHISVEYAPAVPTLESRVGIIVRDTEGTTLAWEKTEQPGAHYQVKEDVITTKPGATVSVVVVNMIARIRWCEVFSC